jgi:hypothetical protein
MRPQELFHLIGEVRDWDELMLRFACEPELVELHWTNRDAFLVRLERDYAVRCERAGHGGLSLFGVRIVENNRVRAGFAQVSNTRGELMTVVLSSCHSDR